MNVMRAAAAALIFLWAGMHVKRDSYENTGCGFRLIVVR